MICPRCGQPVPVDVEPHWDHEPGCTREVCWCDLVVHPECCGICAAEREQEAVA